MFEPAMLRCVLVMLGLSVIAPARADFLLAEIAESNPWVASVLLEQQVSGAFDRIPEGMTVMKSLPTTESVRRRLAGEVVRLAPMPAGVNGRVTRRQTSMSGVDTLQLSAFTVNAENQVLFKVFPDIVIDLAAKSWRRDDNAGPAIAAERGTASERAMAAVRDYSAAFVDRDLDRLAALSHPVLVLRQGGADAYKAMLAELFSQMGTVGSARNPETLGVASEAFVHGKTRMIGVPMIRRVGTHGFAAMYVAVSYDGGISWSVLGLNCTDERWLHAIAPGYRGTPDVLGLANPETAKLLEGKPIDEALFLKGPRAGAS
jgi:hypothetical protein